VWLYSKMKITAGCDNHQHVILNDLCHRNGAGEGGCKVEIYKTTSHSHHSQTLVPCVCFPATLTLLPQTLQALSLPALEYMF
jgi:hypothetical protein